MAAEPGKKPAGMKGGVRKPRGPNGTWSFVIDMGLQDAQRCTDCSRRVWLEAEGLAACPLCRGVMRSTVERRQVTQGGFATQGEAKLARADVLVKLGRGSYVPPQRRTVAEYLRDEWLPAQERRVTDDSDPLKRTTYEGYRLTVHEHLIGPATHPFALGRIEMSKLKRDAIREHYALLAHGYLVERKGKTVKHGPLALESRRRVHACLHKALNDAKERGYIGDNPAWKALKAKKNALRFEGSIWTPEQLASFLTATADSELHPLWVTIATTGLRRGEACGLRWCDVDLKENQLTVRRSRVPVAGEVVESTPKNGRERVVALDQLTVRALRRQRRNQAAARLRLGAEWQGGGDYVFTRPDGRPVEPNSLSREFRLAVKAAGLKSIRLHELRHTHASLLLADGEPMGNVSRRLGHSNSTVTAQVYEHFVPEAEKAAAAHFERILAKGKAKNAKAKRG